MTVTKKEIADYLGISRTAVSLVLNNTPSSTVSEETRNKILNAARELGYRDAEVSPKLCFILYNREANDPRYMNDLKVIEEAASGYNYRLIFMNVKASPLDLQRLQKFLRSRETSGLIIHGDVDDQLIDMIVESELPYVFCVGTRHEHLLSVTTDDRKLAYEATKYLITLGHKKIAFFSGSLGLPIHMHSIDGYKDALNEAGIPLDKSLVQISKEEDGYELCSRMQLLEIDYTAAFCVNTIIQFGVLQQLKEQGISVPHEVSLIGSGNTELVKASIPPLTTIYVRQTEKNRVVDLLIDIIRKEKPKPEPVRLANFELNEGGTVSICRTKDKK